jgi:hypothetical protein
VYLELLLDTWIYVAVDQVGSHLLPQVSQLVSCEAACAQSLRVPLEVSESEEEQIQRWMLHWLGENWRTYELWLLISMPTFSSSSPWRGGDCGNPLVWRLWTGTFSPECQQTQIRMQFPVLYWLYWVCQLYNFGGSWTCKVVSLQKFIFMHLSISRKQCFPYFSDLLVKIKVGYNL